MRMALSPIGRLAASVHHTNTRTNTRSSVRVFSEDLAHAAMYYEHEISNPFTAQARASQRVSAALS